MSCGACVQMDGGAGSALVVLRVTDSRYNVTTEKLYNSREFSKRHVSDQWVQIPTWCVCFCSPPHSMHCLQCFPLAGIVQTAGCSKVNSKRERELQQAQCKCVIALWLLQSFQRKRFAVLVQCSLHS